MASKRELTSDELEEFVRQVFEELDLIYEAIVEECIARSELEHQRVELHLCGGGEIEVDVIGNGNGDRWQSLRDALRRAIRAKLRR